MTNLACDRVKKSTTVTLTLARGSREQGINVPHFVHAIPKCVLHGFIHFVIKFLQSLILFSQSAKYRTHLERDRPTFASYFTFHLTTFSSNLPSIISGSCDFETFPGRVLNAVAVQGHIQSPSQLLTLLRRLPLLPR
jgi:hypothetical protein